MKGKKPGEQPDGSNRIAAMPSVPSVESSISNQKYVLTQTTPQALVGEP